MDGALDYFDNPDYAYFSVSNETISYENVSEEISSRNIPDYGIGRTIDDIVAISTVVICIFGAVGNAVVIWLLGFQIKRNPFNTYIVNLAIADLGVLLSVPYNVLDGWAVIPDDFNVMYPVFLFLFLSTYGASQFLLTAVSIDRCVAVFCPLWHRCHRPPCLSAIVCALIWFLSLLLTSVTYTLILLKLDKTKIQSYYQFFVNALLCLPVMTTATVALSVKVCFKARQPRRGKLLTIILVTLLFFLLFAFPLNVTFILYVFNGLLPYTYGVLLACLNSSVNPAIYILVGRQWKSRQKEDMKMIFQKVFKEEDSRIEETPAETQL